MEVKQWNVQPVEWRHQQVVCQKWRLYHWNWLTDLMRMIQLFSYFHPAHESSDVAVVAPTIFCHVNHWKQTILYSRFLSNVFFFFLIWINIYGTLFLINLFWYQLFCCSQVYKSRYQGGKMKLLNKELVEVEEHTRCKCDCRKKESDCTRFQRYNKAQCMCICINIEDKNKCLGVSVKWMLCLCHIHHWILKWFVIHRRVARKFGMQKVARADVVNQKNVPLEHISMRILVHAKRYIPHKNSLNQCLSAVLVILVHWFVR